MKGCLRSEVALRQAQGLRFDECSSFISAIRVIRGEVLCMSQYWSACGMGVRMNSLEDALLLCNLKV